jgi:predicted RNase H-like HicB family nuclease
MTGSHHKFTVILLPERDPEFKGYFNAVVPALPGCVSYGVNKEDALKNIREAIGAYVMDMEAEGETVPEDEFERVVVEV